MTFTWPEQNRLGGFKRSERKREDKGHVKTVCSSNDNGCYLNSKWTGLFSVTFWWWNVLHDGLSLIANCRSPANPHKRESGSTSSDGKGTDKITVATCLGGAPHTL